MNKNHRRDFYLYFIFIIALVIQIYFSTLTKFDYWGDSYHHYFTSLSTSMTYVYSDIKNNFIFWLPGYHYLGAVIFWIYPTAPIEFFHAMNILFGSVSCLLVAKITFHVTKSKNLAIFTSYLMVFEPTHILYSTLNMPEVFTGFILLTMIWGLLKNNHRIMYITWIIGMMTRYEYWIFGILIISNYIIYTQISVRYKIKLIIYYGLTFLGWIFLWSYWSYINSNDPFQWFHNQFSALAWDEKFYGSINLLDIILLYLKKPIVVLYILFLLVKGIQNLATMNINKDKRSENIFSKQILIIILGRMISVMVFRFPLLDNRFILLDLHIIILAIPLLITQVIPNNIFMTSIKRTSNQMKRVVLMMRKINQNLPAFMLILTIVFSLISYQKINQQSNLDYLINPEYETGLFIRNWIENNNSSDVLDKGINIMLDTPSIAYYAGIEISNLITSDDINWENPYFSIKKLNIKLIVFHNVSYSAFYYHLRDFLSNPLNVTVNELHFFKIFEYAGWELQYGAASIVVYSIT